VGGGESLRVVVRRVGHTHHFRWELEAVSHQEGETVPVIGTVRCFCKEGFVANGPERMISNPFQATDLFSKTKTWNGDAATFISGVNGHLRGGGEHSLAVSMLIAPTHGHVVIAKLPRETPASLTY
jgi:hypothetical protein